MPELREYDCGAKKNPRFPEQVPVPGTPIPTLDEVFGLGKGNTVQFNVETKIFADKPDLTPGSGGVHQVDPRFRAPGGDGETDDTAELRSPYSTGNERLDRAIPRAALFEKQRDWKEVTREFEATVLSPEQHLVTKELVTGAHAAGHQVVPWTANEPAEWAALVAAGSDAIISDDPAALIAWLKAQGLR